MNFSDILAYYSRPEVQAAILELGKGREVVGVYKTGEYSKRPNTVLYSQDILAMVKSGVIEFHSSLERWSNPMLIRPDNHQELRRGWDLVLDIDCKDFRHGKAGALVLMRALRDLGVENFSVKFTGGKGWHIGVPWESVPKEVDYKETSKLYPEIARKAAEYLKEFTRERVAEAFFKMGPEKVAQESGVPLGEFLKGERLDPWKIIEIDPVLISPRHLFRMPYSLNRKTGLVSLPVKPSEVEWFRPEHAEPGKVRVELKYLQQGREGEADGLFMEALDWWAKTRKKEAPERPVRRPELARKVTQEMFPPCIKAILEGLQDGRKRSTFVLINFLSNLKWTWEEIEELLARWNQKNRPALAENYVTGQLRYSRAKGKGVLPPNCSNPAYYKGYGVCSPDSTCQLIKNPVSYPLRLLKQKKGAKK